MPKFHKKFDDDGAPIARDAQGGKTQEPNPSKRGVKRDSDRNSTSKPQNSHPSHANTSGYQKQSAGHKPDSFYGSNKRQKVGHGGFNPVNKFWDQQRESGKNKFRGQGPMPKYGLKTNSNHPNSSSNWNNCGPQAEPWRNSKGADSIKSTSQSEWKNSKFEANPDMKRKLSNSTSTPRPDNISKDGPANEVKVESQSKSTTKWVSRRTPGKVDPSEPKLTEWVRPPRHLTPQQQRVDQLLKKREKLPIFHQGPDIRVKLRERDILILVGETGSGKSTQVPQFLRNEKWCAKQKFNVDGKNVSVGGVIAITQPRKIAATTLAKRVATEMGQLSLKDTNGAVGYAVRFDQFTPKNMVIKFVTEGMLLQDILEDPDLKKYSAVIVDEIHERTLDVDLVTGFLKRIVLGDKKGRHGVPLKVVLMSATADVTALQNFFLDEERSNAVKEIERKALEVSNAPRRPSVSSGTSYSSWEGFSSSSNNQADDKSEASNKKIKDDMAMINRHSPDSSATLEEQVPNNPLERVGNVGKNIYVHVVKGRQYAVKELFLPNAVKDYVDVALRTIHRIHTTRPYPGDILCFMTGEDDIKTLAEMVAKVARDLNTKEVPFLKIMPLYGKMDAASQQQVFEPLKTKRTRKVVLATNVAETSVTVPGVKYVIDSGKVKVKEFRPMLGLDSLLIKPVSKSSAEQRKGRAGRESEGECYRLYTAQQYKSLADSDVPEILRTNILHAVLTMKARGVEDPTTFPLMNSPGPQAIIGAMAQLLALGALSEDGSVTRIGQILAIFPLSPNYGRVIVTASEIGDDCVLDVIDAISCLDADGDIFKRPSSEKEVQDTQSARDSLTRREGDILTILTAMRRYLAQPSKQEREMWCQQHQVNPSTMKNAILVREQLQFKAIKAKLLSAKPDKFEEFEPISEERGENLLKCFLRSFQGKTAVLHPDKSYRTIGGRNLIAIHPSSVLQGKKCEAILYLQQVYTSKHFGKIVNVIQMNWLMEALTHIRGTT